MKLLIVTAALCAIAGGARAADMLPPNTVPVPVNVAQALDTYLADRGDVATRLRSLVEAAANARPQQCPMPADAAKP